MCKELNLHYPILLSTQGHSSRLHRSSVNILIIYLFTLLIQMSIMIKEQDLYWYISRQLYLD